LKATVLALKAGALREDLKAEVPRRSADAIVVSLCMGERESSVLLKGWEVAGGRWQMENERTKQKSAATLSVKCTVTDPQRTKHREKSTLPGG